MDKNICAVIAAYHPDIHVLQQLIRAIRQHVSAIVVVDNTPPTANDAISAAVSETAYIPMGGNKGISRAFNAGADWARRHGCSHVLLMDQDSRPRDGMIEHLSDAEDRLLEQGHKVAAVGPNYIDPNYHNIRPFSRTEKWRVRRYHCQEEGGAAFIQSDFVISSGSLIRVSVLDSVGGFDEKFFIDYVDMEWGLRATSLGYASFGVCNAVLEHQLGEAAITFWFLKTWSVPIHKTFRHYYCFRNALLLYRRPYVPLVWKLRDATMLVLKAAFFSTIPAPRRERLKMICLGLYDGLRNYSRPVRAENSKDVLVPARSRNSGRKAQVDSG